MFDLSSRPEQLQEYMDDPHADRDELDKGLAFIRFVNRRLGGTKSVLSTISPWLADWPRHTPIRILDVATGSADIPLAMLQLASQLGLTLRVAALDLHASTLQLAARHIGDQPAVQLVRGDAMRLPLADRSVDFVTCSLFLHHLTTPEAGRVLGEIVRVAQHGLIVSDLVRSRWALAAITAMTAFSPRLHRHDARVSVAKGWTQAEIVQLAAGAGAGFASYRPRAFARFVLAGRRSG
jgi:ubiquinone/menaquinone biosynthesis C-methylase UbiE